jgi:hypothetical protein
VAIFQFVHLESGSIRIARETRTLTRPEFISRFAVSHRDLRALLCSSSFVETRTGSVLLSLLGISCFVGRGAGGMPCVAVLLTDASEAFIAHFPELVAEAIADEVGGPLEATYELLAIEACLSYATATVAAQYQKISELVLGTSSDPTPAMMQQVSTLSDEVAALHADSEQLRAALTGLLDSDADVLGLAFSNLSVLAGAASDRQLPSPAALTPAPAIPLVAIVDLVEAYLQQILFVSSETDEMGAVLRRKAATAALKLDARRNAIMRRELEIAIVALCIAISALVASVFGMNVPLRLEANAYALTYILVGAGAVSTIVGVAFFAVTRAPRKGI